MAVVAAVLAVVAAAAIAAAVVLSRRATVLRAERDAAIARAEGAEADAVSAREDAASTRAREAAALVVLARRDATVEALWSLELLRVARSWALTAGGLEPPAAVAADTEAELRVALGLDLDQLREEAGIPGDLATVTDGTVGTDAIRPGDALLAFRLQQELLAVVARPSEGLLVHEWVEPDAVVVRTELDATRPVPPEVLRRIAAVTGARIDVDGATATVRVRRDRDAD